jgi:hypothetical protein
MVYWGYCIFWGIKEALSSRTASDFFVSRQQLPFWVFVFAVTATAILVSLMTTDDRKRKREIHAFLHRHTALAPQKRRLVVWAWILTLLWFMFAIGPGTVIGNTVFGHPNNPQSWWVGMPSIWVWQILWWSLGVAMMWFLAYYMEMSTVPEQAREALDEDIAGTDQNEDIARYKGRSPSPRSTADSIPIVF